MLKKYRLGFDLFGLILFIAIMIPNMIWFIVPAPKDILRNESVTLVVDLIASIGQVIMITVLCIVKRTDLPRPSMRSRWFVLCLISCLFYYISWIMYYMGIVTDPVILSLCLFPCLAFILYEVDRRNWIAMVPTIGFTALHLVYGILNFIL